MSADAPAASDARDARDARVRELRDLAASGATRQELVIHLAALGYDTERAAALLDQLEAASAGEALSGESPVGPANSGPASASAAAAPDDPGGPALRVWAPFERARFSPEAWGQLLHLRADGMGDAEFEHLVDRALLQLEGPVGARELRALLGDAVDPAAAPPTVH